MKTATSATDALRRINGLLEAALALPAPQREPWLASLGPEAADVLPRLRAMLARAATETDGFMQRPAALAAVEGLAGVDRAGDRIGPYRLLEEIGHGGMGTVWLAEGEEGGLHRRVALKLPRAGWGGGLERRLLHERDILASLEHPRIARLYTAGTTPEGRPWLAMERVDGVDIDEYCRIHALGVAARLGLFLQVAEAVTYAHGRLVVHRDLKPGNILVTPEGEVRLLDFGIAKLLEGEAAASAPDLTQQLGRAVTPDYASPEQIAGQAVTVASDVYSLGVVLYELLTGERPYRIGRVSAAVMEQAVLDCDIVPASARAGRRRGLAAQLRGDLDAILDKALRKEPVLRYASVDAMAADVRRHLAGEPVLARAVTWRYRATKFVRRHALVLGAGGAVALALSVTTGIALRQWQQSEQRGAELQLAARQADASLDLLNRVLSDAGTMSAQDMPARLRRIRDVVLDSRRQPEVKLRVLEMLALRMGEQYLNDEVLQTLDAMDVLARQVPDAVPYRTAQACLRANALAQSGRVAEAEQLMADVQPRLDQVTDWQERATCQSVHAAVLGKAGHMVPALAAARQAVDLFERHEPGGEAYAQALFELAKMEGLLAQYPKSAEHLRRTREVLAASGLAGTQQDYNVRAQSLLVALRGGRARQAALELAALRTDPRQAADHLMPPYKLQQVDVLITLRFDPARAVAALDAAEALQPGPPRRDEPGTLVMARAEALRQNGRLDAAEEALQALPRADSAGVRHPPMWAEARTLALRAALALDRHDVEQAHGLVSQALMLLDADAQEGIGARFETLLVASRVALARRDDSAARTLAQDAETQARSEALDPASSASVGLALLAQARVLVQSDPVAAARRAAQAVPHLRDNLALDHPALAEALALSHAPTLQR